MNAQMPTDEMPHTARFDGPGVTCCWVHQAVTRLLPSEVNMMADIDGEKPDPAATAVFAHLFVYAVVASVVRWAQASGRRKPP